MGSDVEGRVPTCLAHQGKAGVDFLGTARDERLASRFGAYHGPSAIAPDRTTHDGAKRVHWRQMHFATQQRGVEDRKQEQLRAHVHSQDNASNNQANLCSEGSGHVLMLSCREVPVSCARHRAGPSDVMIHRLPATPLRLVVDLQLSAATAVKVLAAQVMAVQWLVARARSAHPSIADQHGAPVQAALVG